MNKETQETQEAQGTQGATRKRRAWSEERKGIYVWATLNEMKTIDRLCKKHKMSRGKVLLEALKTFASK